MSRVSLFAVPTLVNRQAKADVDCIARHMHLCNTYIHISSTTHEKHRGQYDVAKITKY